MLLISFSLGAENPRWFLDLEDGGICFTCLVFTTFYEERVLMQEELRLFEYHLLLTLYMDIYIYCITGHNLCA